MTFLLLKGIIRRKSYTTVAQLLREANIHDAVAEEEKEKQKKKKGFVGKRIMGFR